MTKAILCASSLAIFCTLGDLSAQESSIDTVGAPTAQANETFSKIIGLRELSDGRVLVTDWLEQRLAVVDFENGTVDDVGSVGSGPQEYRLPRQLLALPGDSTLMVDIGNSRLTVISPDLQFARTFSPTAHGEAYSMNPTAADAQGEIYFALSPFALGPPRSDSVPIARWSSGSGLRVFDQVRIKTSTPRARRESRLPGIPIVMYAGRDDWSVAPDGWLAVVRSDSYRVDWIAPDGRTVVGPTISYEKLEVSTDDKRDAVREFLLSTYQAGRGQGPTAITRASVSEQEVNRMARSEEFAEEFPPFVPGKVFARADGTVCVQRYLRSNARPELDVIDRSGARIRTIVLPQHRALVGLGADHLYATWADEMGLLTLERYQLP